MARNNNMMSYSKSYQIYYGILPRDNKQWSFLTKRTVQIQLPKQQGIDSETLEFDSSS